jgi:hypothetical protein
VAEIAQAIAGADAVVFAAGARPDSGLVRKWTVDRAAIKLFEAARGARADPYLMISSFGTENPPDGDDVFSVYLRAKAPTEEALKRGRSCGRDACSTIRAPAACGSTASRFASVPRDDVAAVVHACTSRGSMRRILYVGGGEDAIEQAPARALGAD